MRRIALLVGVVAVVVAFLAGRASTSRPPADAGRTVGPVHVANFSALAFGVDAVRALNSPQMVDRSYRGATLARFLDPSARTLGDRFVPGPAFEQATGLSADRAGGRTTVAEVVPMAASAGPVTAGQVQVSVWAVTVVGTRRLGQLVASWSTETVTARLGRDGWRVVGYRSTAGPVPAATQPPTDVRKALAAVAGMRGVPDAG